MERMLLVDREREKIKMRGIENLYDMGGFIQGQIEEEFYRLYPDEVVEAALKYFPIGQGIWDVLDGIDQTFDKLSMYRHLNRNGDNESPKHRYFDDDDDYDDDECFDDDELPFVQLDEDFDEWLVDQAARIASQNVKNGTAHFWSGWKLRHSMKSALEKLNVLEERVLILSNGLEDAAPMTAGQIAKSEEFSCPIDYINILIDAIEKSFDLSKCSNEEFAQACAEYKSR